MKIKFIFSISILFTSTLLIAQQNSVPQTIHSQSKRVELSLNGTWDFAQTPAAFAPVSFLQKIPVPGLIHLAVPKIAEYDKFFKRPDKVNANTDHNVFDIDYSPMYNWYHKKIFVPGDLSENEAVLSIKKSQYVTQVFVNGIDLGNFIECYTPIEVAVTRALKFGQENEILVKTGDRYWMPSQAAGGTDKEKEHYLPGIWDDVSLSFTKKLRIHKILLLPSLKAGSLTAKLQVWNLNHAQVIYGETMKDSLSINIKVFEARSRKLISSVQKKFVSVRDRLNEITIDLPVESAHPWTPEDPFLYTTEISLYDHEEISDRLEKKFGMRDFERKGKFFYLNGKKYYLRGSNITLQRFFEDPDCGDLAWNKQWVKKMLIDEPKKLNWNSMRLCVGIVPDFWYDMADEYGLLFQNEWFYWQNHGWDEQVRKEYTDWVWSDGSHPSIVIWDAINENQDDYIGNGLIPELKKLDTTRIWDAGYMTASSMMNDDMDEPHPYMGVDWGDDKSSNDVYPLGDLDYKPGIILDLEAAKSAQLVNEYGWVWLWRNGTPSKLTVSLYEKYVGKNSTVSERRNFQAYWLQLETEWLRSNQQIAGVLAFCYLTNNYGYTGDWFQGNIKDLQPTPTLKWFKECFAPVNIFIDLADERYVRNTPSQKPGTTLNFSLCAVSDLDHAEAGQVKINLLNSFGKIVYNKTIDVSIEPFERKRIPFHFTLPATADGYLLQTIFIEKNDRSKSHSSRRYIRVGDLAKFQYYDLPDPL
ncbi:MAG: sugar-binding domain-containing protein [Ginsengibacter sp.]